MTPNDNAAEAAQRMAAERLRLSSQIATDCGKDRVVVPLHEARAITAALAERDARIKQLEENNDGYPEWNELVQTLISECERVGVPIYDCHGYPRNQHECIEELGSRITARENDAPLWSKIFKPKPLPLTKEKLTEASLRARLDRAEGLLLRAAELIDAVAVAEDRSNLDGDALEIVVQQLNEQAEELLPAIRTHLEGGRT